MENSSLLDGILGSIALLILLAGLAMLLAGVREMGKKS
jgi:hypothetical protein